MFEWTLFYTIISECNKMSINFTTTSPDCTQDFCIQLLLPSSCSQQLDDWIATCLLVINFSITVYRKQNFYKERSSYHCLIFFFKFILNNFYFAQKLSRWFHLLNLWRCIAIWASNLHLTSHYIRAAKNTGNAQVEGQPLYSQPAATCGNMFRF